MELGDEKYEKGDLLTVIQSDGESFPVDRGWYDFRPNYKTYVETHLKGSESAIQSDKEIEVCHYQARELIQYVLSIEYNKHGSNDRLQKLIHNIMRSTENFQAKDAAYERFSGHLTDTQGVLSDSSSLVDRVQSSCPEKNLMLEDILSLWNDITTDRIDTLETTLAEYSL